jgi:predicted transcriptional regulator
MVKRGALELEKRKKIYNYILRNPGLHLSELARKLDIPKTTLNYHLKYLEKKGKITSRSGSLYLRYFPANKLKEIDKNILNLIRQDIPCEIIIYLFLNPYSSRLKISEHLKKHPTTISFHLYKLMDKDIIESFKFENEGRYRIKHTENVLNLLLKYGRRFLDEEMC